MEFFDSVSLGDARVTTDGYMVVNARIARIGIQTYAGHEIGRPDMATVRVFRPEGEVFASDAMASLAYKPLTVDHPSEAVTAKNWKRHAVGFTGAEVARDGGFIRVPLTLMDAASIDAVNAGKRELSVGYSCILDWTAGTSPEGEAYDAVQRNIRGNHLAIVDAARAGPACRVGDQSRPQPEGERPVTDKNLKTITVDGIPVDVTDAAAAVIAKMQVQITDAQKASGEAAAKIEAKDGEIAALKAKLADAEMTPARIDAAVAERAAVIDAARKVMPTLDATGKTLPAIRREAVTAKLADAKDMSDAAIEGAFKVLSSGTAPRDPLRDGKTATALGDADAAFAENIAFLQNAHKKGA